MRMRLVLLVTFTMMVDKLDVLLGVSEKANKLAEFRNDVAKKGLVQTIKDNRTTKAEAEREEALQESGSTGIGFKVADVANKTFEPLKNIFGGLKAVFLGAGWYICTITCVLQSIRES